MALLAAVSFLGALLEAGLLVIITGVAMALVANRSTVGPVLGQSVDLSSALALGALILVIRLALNVVTVRISSQLTTDVTTDQRLALSHAYLRASWSVQQAERAGRLQELLTSFVTRATWTINVLTQSITSALSLLAFMVAGLLVDPLSAIAVMVALVLVGTVLTPLKRRVRARSSTFSQSNLAFSRAVSELAALGLEMQTFGVQDRFAERIDSLTLETSRRQRSVQTLTGLLAPIYISLAYAALLAGVALLNVVGVSNLTVVGAVMLLMLRSLSYGQQLATAWGSVAANAPFLDRLDETVQRYSASPARMGSIVPSGVTPVQATDVAFGYLPDRLALSSASFTLERGEIVGVIGPSGGGKSTLAQLLLGVRDPTAGVIRVGGADLREVDRAWWSERVAFVAQDALLLTGTVTENIRFLRQDVDDAAVVGAARRANILRDIEALPDGFGTHLGERGSQLSGGQRQRLSIARALAGNPELLVLDEPTSALDGQSESLIRDTLTELKGVVTVVMIAHRMSTLDICDRIMVIERGHLTGIGTPAALQKADGFYRRSMSMAGLSERE